MSVTETLTSLPVHIREAIDAAYANGYAAGLASGIEQQQAFESARWATMSRRIVALGTSPSAAELAEQRGEPDRARAIRENHARLGLGLTA